MPDNAAAASDKLARLFASQDADALGEYANSLRSRIRMLREAIERSPDPNRAAGWQRDLRAAEAELKTTLAAEKALGIKRPRGRPHLGTHALTAAERSQHLRKRDGNAIKKVRQFLKRLERSHPQLVGDLLKDPDVRGWIDR